MRFTPRGDHLFRMSIVAALVLWGLVPLWALEIPVIQFSGNGPDLQDYALIRDPQRNLERDQVVRRLERGDFVIHHQEVLDNFGFTQDVLWIAFKVNNRSVQGSNTFVEILENNLANVRVHIRRSLSANVHIWSMEQSGAHVPINKRAVPVSSLIFNAALPPLTDALFLCRVENLGPNRIHINFLNGPRIFASQENSNALLLAYLGALATLMLYNMLLFAAIRDRSFIWFVLHLFFLAGYIFAASGFGFRYIWSFSPEFQAFAAPAFICCIVISVLIFARQFVETRQFLPRLDRLIIIHMAVVALYLPFLAINYPVTIWVGELLLLFSISLILVTGIQALVNRHPNAQILLIATACLIGGALLTQATAFGLVPSGWSLAILSHADYAGIFLEAFILSFALSRKLQRLRVLKEEAETKNRLKQSFIANVSHEMRTPLNAIIGFAESIQDLHDPDLMRLFNSKVLAESERLLFQINQVLDLAKLEADHLVIDVAPFNLTESMDYIDSVFRNQAEGKGIELIVQVRGDSPNTVLGDRLRFEQVLRNLVDNAIKFTESGSIFVLAECAVLNEGFINVAVSVRDTGIGIPSNKQSEIFEEFVQADSSITRRFGGTGLGTSISQKLVAAMGGSLSLESRPGEGSVFSFNLSMPICKAPTAESAVATSQQILQPKIDTGIADIMPASVTKPNKPRILVVDDFETNRQVVCIHLSRLEVEVDSAASGPEALDFLYRRHYDLVLLDLFMPGLSGHDVVRIIRERWSAENLPVLGLTASGAEADLSEAVAAGMNGVMVKPVKRSDLISQIRQYIPTL